MFASTPGGLRAGRVHHEPYAYRSVELLEWGSRPLALNGFEVPSRGPDHAVASPGVDVSVFRMREPSRVLDSVPGEAGTIGPSERRAVE